MAIRIFTSISFFLILFQTSCKNESTVDPIRPIDREALVSRHNIQWDDLSGQIPLGNGEFCFNADGTGLQTFGGNTMSHWAWHSFPLPEDITPDQVPQTGTFQNGRNTGPDTFPEGTSELRQWMFDNPHIFNLGRIRLIRSDGNELKLTDIRNVKRTHDLWTGILTSDFEIDGHPVKVVTCIHPKKDVVSVKLSSPLFEDGRLGIELAFPYPNLERYEPWVGDFKRIKDNLTTLLEDSRSDTHAEFRRNIDNTRYYTTLDWSKGAQLIPGSDSITNNWRLQTNAVSSIEFSVAYSKERITGSPLDFLESSSANQQYWAAFWKNGGAIDLSESKDPRWMELERRIVLSQYLMAVQSAGSLPPAEGGLMGIGPWRGQFHMEMIWWHLAHYALWNRWEMAEDALECYDAFMPASQALAEQLGYKGFKWPKSVGPEGRSAPWEGNQVLLWKQPHPIFFAELDYRTNPTSETLEKWKVIVEGTAVHMADYATLDPKTGNYHLDPAMPPSEQGITKDDIFDLAYWHWGLELAQVWRERLGLERIKLWDDVKNNLAELPVKDGLYLHSPEWFDTYSTRNWEHPNTVGVWGMLPPQKNMDFNIAHNSLLKVWETWEWERCWGWDFPWTAMAAARLGEPDLAVDALLKDAGTKNHYDERGVCTGGPTPYLPGNGGLLYAVAMMAAGWDGGPDRHAPGFPDNGSWVVRWEGLEPAP